MQLWLHLGVFAGFAWLLIGTQGRQAIPFILAVGSFAVFGVVESALFFPVSSFSNALQICTIFMVALFLGSLVGGRGKGRPWVEAGHGTPRIKFLLVLGAAAAVYAQLHILAAERAQYVVTNLYQLNIAASSLELQSFGLWGRVNRLAIPLAIYAAVLSLHAVKRSDKVQYVLISAAYIVALLGPRRSIVFYVAIAIGFVVLLHNYEKRNLRFRTIVFVVLSAVALEWGFGFVQIATHKSTATSAFSSGFNDGSLYAAGSLPYADCVPSSSPGTKWSAFVALDHYIGGDKFAGAQPFCRLPDGRLFNTAPGYINVYFAYGVVAVAVFGLALGLIYVWLRRSRHPSIGLQALVLTAIAFQLRENLLGQLDYIQALAVYAVVVFAAEMHVRRKARIASAAGSAVKRQQIAHV